MRIITIYILIVLSSTLIGYAADFDYPAQWKEVEELRKKDQNFKEALSSALEEFSEFNQCERVIGSQKFLNLNF